MSKFVVVAVLVLAAVATADAFRATPRHEVLQVNPTAGKEPLVVHRASSGLIAVGSLTRNRVLKNGREYLSREAVDAAFADGLEGVPFDIAYVAEAEDGIVALGVYKFPGASPVRAAVQLWRGKSLVSIFEVPAGAFAGGLGFAQHGRLVATLSSDGLLVHLFRRDGSPAGRQPATSW